MAFTDVIDNYADKATGTITANNETVGYTVASTLTSPAEAQVTTTNTDQGARINANGSETMTVTFDAPVQGVTLSFDRSNSPEIYKVIIDGVTVNIQDLIDAGTATFTTVIAATGATGTHVIENGGITSVAGGFNNGSLGFVTFNTAVTSVGVFGTGGGATNFDIIEIGIDDGKFNVVCFVAGTLIATPTGPRKVEDLRAGDPVITADGQTHHIRAAHGRQLSRTALYHDTRLLPVRIAAGALGAGLPQRDLLVSRQHRIVVASRIAQRICGQARVLVPAFRLVGLPGITVARDVDAVSYHHILLDDHAVVLANGAPAETLFTGQMAAAALHDDPDRLLSGITPGAMTPALPFATADQARDIAAAHLRHGRALLESWETALV